ncbi:MAG: 50S ribosomal protein L3 N(5)-glutamine methyltransferase [Gammaproteobacteria bacterium]|nr:50S ribosomal protein L3 N(5)-glutamine methyltransferase [Gammaproteobacteria bacterium]
MTEPYTTPQTVRDWILWAEAEMDAAGVYFGHGTDNALDEAAWLVGGALKLAPDDIEPNLDHAVNADQQNAVRALVAQRIHTRKPAAYLLHEAWFAGLKFYVDERVIVPRSLTGEFIQEQFAPWIDTARVRRVLDLCTGSGCMAIACAYAFTNARVDAADISEDALAVARINVEQHGLRERVRLLRSDLFSALTHERYDVIVTNPPYVALAEMDTLPDEYQHEPELALASGTQGLDDIVNILGGAAAHLEPDGILIAEVGNSHEALQAAFPEVPFLWLTTSGGDESVFLLTAEQLVQFQKSFMYLWTPPDLQEED